MSLPRLPLEVGRLITLIVLGLLTAPLGTRLMAAETRFETAAMWLPTAGLALVTVAFVTVALMGRLGRDGLAEQPAGTLALEGVAAAAFALVPSVLWVTTFGVGSPLVQGILYGSLQPLAGVWLATVGLVAIRRRAARRVVGKQPIFS